MALLFALAPVGLAGYGPAPSVFAGSSVLAFAPGLAWADDTTTESATTVQASASGLSTSPSLPASYDTRTEQLVSPVRLQDPWGACWAFAPLAAMEANLVKQGLADTSVQLSPRHLIYFAGTPVGSEAGAQKGEGQIPIDSLVAYYEDNAVFEMGGHALEVASAISSGEGVAFETDAPYRNNEGILDDSKKHYAAEGTWALSENKRYTSAFTLRNMYRLPNPATYTEEGNVDSFKLDTDALNAVKQAIATYGAVSVSYCSYHGEEGHANYYDANNFTFFTNATTVVDHDVCIVGWDDSYPALNFTTGTRNGEVFPEGDGAWIVKNSWGALTSEFPNKDEWGESGYFYLSYYDRSAQGYFAWEMMSPSDPDATTITNQHDYMGQRSNSETRISNYEPAAYANVFTAEESQLLRAVSVNTYAPNTKVEIRLYKLAKNALSKTADPTQGKLLEKKTLTCSWGGYHRIQLDDEYLIRKGERFSVVVSMRETDAEGNDVYVASIEAGNNAAMVDTYGLAHYDTVICNAGETCILATIDGEQRWVDGVEFATMLHEIANDGAYYGNACIKVFADPYEEDASPVLPTVRKKAVGTKTSSPTQSRATANTADIPVAPLCVLAVFSAVGIYGAGRRQRYCV